jgi:arabinan endo-1,5-alpha-L-arabinosidase
VAKPLIFPNASLPYQALVEGAWVQLHRGLYYMYYSGDYCCGPQANYAVMVARCETPGLCR